MLLRQPLRYGNAAYDVGHVRSEGLESLDFRF